MIDNAYTFKIVGTDKTAQMFKNINQNIRTTINTVGKYSAAMATGIAAGLTVMTKSQMGAIDSLGKMSDRLNIATEDLVAFRHLTVLNGESVTTFEKGLEKMVRGIGEANRGLGTAKPAFEELGLSIENLSGLDARGQFLTIAESINQIENQSKKASLAADIFGRSGIGLINTLSQGTEGFEAARKEADRLGISISRLDAFKVEAANDALYKMQQVGTGLGRQFAVEVAPIIEVIANKLTDVGTEGDRMGSIVKGAFTTGAKIAGTFANGIHGIQIIIKGVEVAAKGMAFVFAGGIVGIADAILGFRKNIIEGMIWPIKKVMELMAPFSDSAAAALVNVNNMLDNVSSGVSENVKMFVEAQAVGFKEAKDQLHNMLMEKLPSDVIKENIDKILSEAEIKAQEATAKIKAKLETQSATTATDAPKSDPLDEERAKLAAKVALIAEYQNIELFQLQQKEVKDRAVLRDALQKQAIDHEEYQQKLTKIEKYYSDQRTALKAREFSSVVGKTGSFFNDLITITTSSSGKMFKRQQKVALAQAYVSLPAAVIETFKNAGGFPWGVGPAIAMAAKGMAQIKSIKKQNVSAPGGTVSVGGSSSTSGVTDNLSSTLSNLPTTNEQQEGSGKQVIIQVNGDVVSNDSSIGSWLINKIKPEIDDNDAVLFDNPNSAQAQMVGG